MLDPPAAAPKAGRSLRKAVEAQRAERLRLNEELDQTRRMPQHSSETKAAIRQQVEALAARGAPDVLRSVELGVPLAWPVVPQHFLTVLGFTTGSPVGGRAAVPAAPDTLALFTWLHRDALLARLEAEVDELSDDEGALTEAERAEREAGLLAAILACERAEEAIISLAEAQGTEIARRERADPRAILGLAAPER